MKKLSRRIVLRGLGGAAFALPVLESLGPSRAKAQDVDPFVLFFRQANGVQQAWNGEPERFFPTQEGALSAGTVEGRALDELRDHLGHMLVIKGLRKPHTDYHGGHSQGALQNLTCAPVASPNTGEGDDEAGGPSIDYLIAQQLNPSDRGVLYLHAGDENGWLNGPCLSYRGSADRLSAERSPWEAYRRMMGGDSGLSEQAQQLVANRRMSVNDFVRDQLSALQSHPGLGKNDRDRIELHQQSVRDLEVNLGCALAEDRERMLEAEQSIFNSRDGDDALRVAELHLEVAALAFACGYTRVATIQVGGGNDAAPYTDPISGVKDHNFHFISHRVQSHGSDGAAINNAPLRHHGVDRLFARTFKRGLDRLWEREMPGGKRLLEHGVALWLNDQANGPPHQTRGDLPFVLAGGANGQIKQGEYMRLSNDIGTNRLLNTIANAIGMRKNGDQPFDNFGTGISDDGFLDAIET